jgi:hypothetical protein
VPVFATSHRAEVALATGDPVSFGRSFSHAALTYIEIQAP